MLQDLDEGWLEVGVSHQDQRMENGKEHPQDGKN